MRVLRQSTAVSFAIGPFVDSGNVPVTSLTIAAADVRLKKGSAAWASKNEASASAHQENGFYHCSLNTTDTNTQGSMRMAVNKSGAQVVWEDFMVLSQATYDAWVVALPAGSTAPTVDQIGDELETRVVGANLVQIQGSVALVDKLATHVDTILVAKFAAGTTATSLVLAAADGIDGGPPAGIDDYYNGRIIVIRNGTQKGQARLITDYIQSTRTITVSALAAAPVAGDLAIIA